MSDKIESLTDEQLSAIHKLVAEHPDFTAFNPWLATISHHKARADALAAQHLITEGALQIAQAELSRAIESNVALAAQVEVLERNQRTPGTVEVCENHVYKECRNHGGGMRFDQCKVNPCPLRSTANDWAKVAELTKPQDRKAPKRPYCGAIRTSP